VTRGGLSPTPSPAHTHRPEAYASALGAVVVLAGLLVLSTMTYVFDLGDFRRHVSRFFRVEQVSPRSPASTRETTHQVARAHEDLLSEVEENLFENHETANDRPRLEEITRSAPPAAPPVRLPESLADPRREALKTAERAGAMLAVAGADGALVRRPGRAGPAVEAPDLNDLYAAGGEGGGGPGRPGALGAEAAKPRFNPPVDPAPAAVSRVSSYAPLGDRPVEDTRLWTRTLIEERPAAGYPSLDEDVSAEFTVHRVPGSDESFFRLEVALRPESPLPRIPKDVLFLFDISGSVGQRELVVMRRAVLEELAHLSPEDRWNLATFSEKVRFYAEDWRPAEAFAREREQVARFVRRRLSERTTNVFDATQKLLAGLPGGRRPCNVYLISDGRATRGRTDVETIVQDFQRVRRDNFSIFTFDAGPDGNRYLLRLLSYRSRGFHEEAPDLDVAEHRFDRFTEQYREPVLTHVVLNYANLEPQEVYPQVLPNLYRAHPLVIVGRSAAGRTVTMRLAGLGADGPREFFFRTMLPRENADHPDVARAWAQGKAHALMAQLAEHPDDEALRERIVRLATEYQLSETLGCLERGDALDVVRNLRNLIPFGRDRSAR